MKKLALALFVTSRKLRHYFQSFSIIVLTERPLRNIIENMKATGRIAKWAAELNPYGIKYEPRTAIKGQVLANFIVGFTPGDPTQSDSQETWILNVDEATNSNGSGVGLVITTFEDSIIEQSFTLGFPTTNNEVEYENVIVGLRITAILGITGLVVRCNSALVVCQVNREYVKDERMEAYLKLVLSLKAKFFRYDFKRVPRSENNHADSLANLASTIEYQFRREILVKHIPTPSIQRSDKEILRLNTSPGWKDHIITYLKNGTTLSDKAEAQKLQHMATKYMLIGELLYKKFYSKLQSDPT